MDPELGVQVAILTPEAADKGRYVLWRIAVCSMVLTSVRRIFHSAQDSNKTWSSVSYGTRWNRPHRLCRTNLPVRVALERSSVTQEVKIGGEDCGLRR